MEPYLGEIRLFPWSWAPQGWLPCLGQLLLVKDYMALAILLGDRYGGDGRLNFGIPNLGGRVALGEKTSTGTSTQLALRELGSSGGRIQATMEIDNMASHTHLARVTLLLADGGPAGGIPATVTNIKGNAASNNAYVPFDATKKMQINSATVASTPGMPMENMQPSIVGNFCIAISGTYPPR